jgi:hypothetical protein
MTRQERKWHYRMWLVLAPVVAAMLVMVAVLR